MGLFENLELAPTFALPVTNHAEIDKRKAETIAIVIRNCVFESFECNDTKEDQRYREVDALSYPHHFLLRSPCGKLRRNPRDFTENSPTKRAGSLLVQTSGLK